MKLNVVFKIVKRIMVNRLTLIIGEVIKAPQTTFLEGVTSFQN